MADNFDIKDFTAGTAVKVKSTDNAGVHTPHHIVDSVGGTVTISGTVTANLSATDNAVLDAIEADTTTLAGAVSGTEMQVDIVTSALPTGAATAANQSTGNTALAAIQTAVELIDNAVSGSELQVDVVTSALPTGAATSANQATEQGLLGALNSSKVTDPDAASASLNSLMRGLIQQMIDATVSDSVSLEPQAYETVPASASTQALGATGASGDYLAHIVIQPTSTTMGAVTVFDGAVEVYAHPGGTVEASLIPIPVPIAAKSVSGAWNITTGTGVKVTAIGTFT